MNIKVLMMAALVTPLMFGCAKKSEEKTVTSSDTQATATSADQQAKIDALDKPVLDAKNTDVSATSAVTPSH
ncbi:hypothetical protein [Acinetobacter rathckeae]|uniref:hypothetical protein n=1 Tax=Acinetobacter rathckeae TaxID=2605272 RepID=UPI0018A2864C|nr:hypothetical protein [Acinetobacter rathckeae]MBF7687297.1 hypothetical protein [Acinetobacter rathckeae]MBF7694350.1 hypothetical protein [Acinetobacter rathckeae]